MKNIDRVLPTGGGRGEGPPPPPNSLCSFSPHAIDVYYHTRVEIYAILNACVYQQELV